MEQAVAEAQAVSEPEPVAAPSEPEPEPIAVSSPSVGLQPIAVVQAQLQALQSRTLDRCFDFISPSARRNIYSAELFVKTLHDTPDYQPLAHGSHYEIRSALATTARNWQCRVHVDGRDYRWHLSQQPEQVLDIGQCMQHKQLEYSGVIVGRDDVCRRPEEWCQLMGIDALPGGRQQPFYHVMLNSGGRHDGPADLEDSETTYVPQDLIDPQPPLAPVDLPAYAKLLFTGDVDEQTGTWEPTPFLRGVYPRGVESCWLVDAIVPDEPDEAEVPP